MGDRRDIADALQLTPPPDGTELDPSDIRDLTPLAMDSDGRMRVLPAAFWEATTTQERALFGHRHGIYLFPTVELVAALRSLIGDRTAIEIGAGNGVLADALGIVGTDSYQQVKEPYASYYALHNQPAVKYGPNVVEVHASRAVRQYRPQVVIGCWVTHKWDPARPQAGGNEQGIDEADMLLNCEDYISVGNEQVHRWKAIWPRRHTIEFPPWLYSRAANGSPDYLAVWPGARRSRGVKP